MVSGIQKTALAQVAKFQLGKLLTMARLELQLARVANLKFRLQQDENSPHR